MLDKLVTYQIRPNAERLKAIVSELIGWEVDEETLWLCVFSVVAQLCRLRPGFSPDGSNEKIS